MPTAVIARFSPPRFFSRLAFPPHGFGRIVETLTRDWASVWEQVSCEFPGLVRAYTRAEQLGREQAAEEIVRRYCTRKPPHRKGVSRVIGLVAQMDDGRDADRETCRVLLEEMADAGERFAADARSFDGTLAAESLAQALRNLWVMNSIQILCGCPVEVTPSCFAYSLLYPYTDNLLDAPELHPDEKRSFILRLGERLGGRIPAATTSAREERIWHLIGEIEREWPRQRFPLVYQSLLAIHAAQTDSLLLHRAARQTDRETVLRLTFAKGGTSVLAHGFLLQGILPEVACRWIFGFGTVLQMIDDLQDLNEDRSGGHETLFTGCRSAEELPRLINRLLCYAEHMAADFPEPADRKRKTLLRLIRGSSMTLVCEAVASMGSSVPPSYAATLEARSPLSFASLRSLRKRSGDLLTSKSLNMFSRTSGPAATRSFRTSAS
jgi:hypothetical protein